jgi:hypothetical protein
VTPLGGLDQRLLLPEELLRTVVQPVLLIWAEDPNGGEATTLAFVGGTPDRPSTSSPRPDTTRDRRARHRRPSDERLLHG